MNQDRLRYAIAGAVDRPVALIAIARGRARLIAHAGPFAVTDPERAACAGAAARRDIKLAPASSDCRREKRFGTVFVETALTIDPLRYRHRCRYGVCEEVKLLRLAMLMAGIFLTRSSRYVFSSAAVRASRKRSTS